MTTSLPAPARFSSVVPIRPSGSEPPLFLIHGVGGVIPDSEKLLEKLNPRHPVYGVQAQAFDPTNPALTALEEIAAYHLKEICQLVPRGPYCFIGFSFGGMIAFEMAQQLRAQGEKAGFVGMIDSCEMSYFKRQSKSNPPGIRTIEISQRLKKRLTEAFQSPNTLVYMKEKIQSRVFRMLYSVVSGCDVPIPKFLQSPYHVNWFAAVNYSPRPYAGRITLFKAKDHFWENGIPPDLGWGALAVEGVEIFEIPGSHVNLFIEPHVSILGEKLTRCLEGVSAQDPSSTESDRLKRLDTLCLQAEVARRQTAVSKCESST